LFKEWIGEWKTVKNWKNANLRAGYLGARFS
jgi:hypothetical protein